MSENVPRPGDPGQASDPGQVRPDGVLRGTGESIVIQQPETGRPLTSKDDDEEPEVFASTVRRKPLSEAGYNENPPSVGKLGVILGTIVALLLVGSGVTLWINNRPDAPSDTAASDAA